MMGADTGSAQAEASIAAPRKRARFMKRTPVGLPIAAVVLRQTSLACARAAQPIPSNGNMCRGKRKTVGAEISDAAHTYLVTETAAWLRSFSSVNQFSATTVGCAPIFCMGTT